MPGYVKPPRNGFVSGTTEMIPSLSSQVPLTIKGATSQTGNLQEWKDSSGNTLSRISSSGVVYGGGLTNVIPTSVVVGSGTSSVSANGAVTFSGATTVSLNGCFTSNYDNYRLIYEFPSSSTSSGAYLRLAINGVATFDGPTDYSWSRYYASGTTLANNGGATAANGVLLAGFSASTLGSVGVADIFSPGKAKATGFAINGTYANLMDNGFGTHSLATSYDGLRIYPTSGNFTGTIRIYGFNNG